MQDTQNSQARVDIDADFKTLKKLRIITILGIIECVLPAGLILGTVLSPLFALLLTSLFKNLGDDVSSKTTLSIIFGILSFVVVLVPAIFCIRLAVQIPKIPQEKMNKISAMLKILKGLLITIVVACTIMMTFGVIFSEGMTKANRCSQLPSAEYRNLCENDAKYKALGTGSLLIVPAIIPLITVILLFKWSGSIKTIQSQRKQSMNTNSINSPQITDKD